MKPVFLLTFLAWAATSSVSSQSLKLSAAFSAVRPLQEITVSNIRGNLFRVFDGKGRNYFSSQKKPVVSFFAGGELGRHTIKEYDATGKLLDSISFILHAPTDISGDNHFSDMFRLFHEGMYADADAKDGVFHLTWNGNAYDVIVPWVLDNFQTMKGMKYFIPNGRQLVDIMRGAQRQDGMIYSFIQTMPNADYYLTRDKFSNYSQKLGDRIFVRQPVENHPEYLYVNTIYDCWKSEGDDAWMKSNIVSAARALDYCLHDPARWSKRFRLLKRVYTIDSWDFAVEDEYMPDLGITNTMIIDPVKSKFGIFFGDNTGYVTACRQLGEMMAFADDTAGAALYRQRGREIQSRLDSLSWNGRFFTHFIEDDTTVQRHLGVDEKSQIAQSNAYSLNRDISHAQSKAIIETYLDLKNHLPPGSPGEWYAIYPPFQKGFERHNKIWQYMNGGVGGHVAGELARGAYENGYEAYATDVLNRLYALGKKYGDKIRFAYTGATEAPPPPPVFNPLNLSSFANMNHSSEDSSQAIPWMNSKRAGDDFRNLPSGLQTMAGIPFQIIDPAQHSGRSVIAISKQSGFPGSVEIPVHDSAACIYLLHTSSKPESEAVAASTKIVYEDGTSRLQYLIMGKQLTYWWFSELKTDYSGIAWYGKNAVSEGIGLSWCAIDNPEPHKKISKIVLLSQEGNSIYTLFAMTLASRPHAVPIDPASFGGPDNWAAATAMASLVEGLAGVKESAGSKAFSKPMIAPRWGITAIDSIAVTIRYAASRGYVAYQYTHDMKKRKLIIRFTGSGNGFHFHVLLPEGIGTTKMVLKDGRPIHYQIGKIENSSYVDLDVGDFSPGQLEIRY